MYQIFRRIDFEITGDEVLNQRNVNPLLKEFRGRLERFRLIDKSVQLWVEVVDDFQYHFLEPTRFRGSYHLNIEYRDRVENGSADRYNEFMVSKLNHYLKELDFEKNRLVLSVKP
jgi:hypothetical protein